MVIKELGNGGRGVKFYLFMDDSYLTDLCVFFLVSQILDVILKSSKNEKENVVYCKGLIFTNSTLTLVVNLAKLTFLARLNMFFS